MGLYWSAFKDLKKWECPLSGLLITSFISLLRFCGARVHILVCSSLEIWRISLATSAILLNGSSGCSSLLVLRMALFVNTSFILQVLTLSLLALMSFSSSVHALNIA